jgi:dTMP kinase
MIRQAMKGRVAFSASTEAFDAQMAYLFAADRFDHLYNEVDGVEKFLGEGVDVVSTRYYFSSFAYHCGDAKSFDLVRRLNSDFPAPDLVVYLNNPVSLSIERMAARKHKDQYENEAKLKHVSNNYAEIFSKYNGKLLALDAREPAETLHEQIYDYVKVL